MKISEWLRQYQISGEVPDNADDPLIAFWAGWLIGISHRGEIGVSLHSGIEIAIKAAEFIEAHAR